MSQAQYKKRLKALMNKPENQVCSDCPERQPRWASLIVPPPGAPPGSLPIGAFCCLECSGSHRRLGVHISFVRSINLDSWKEKEVLAMENGGNRKVNAIFEARMGPGAKKPTSTADGPTRERFIRDKYERRKYYDAAAFETYVPDAEPAAAATSSKRGGKVSRQPSEAARLRAESRRARGGTASAAPKAPMPKAAPPPVPAAKEVDLLDFAAFDEPAPAPAPAAQPTSPNLDLFANMTVNDSAPAAATSPAQPARKTNDDIMAMFSTPSTATQGASAVAMSTPNGGLMMAGTMPQQNVRMNNPMMMQNNGMVMMQGGQASNMGFPQQQPNMLMMNGGFGGGSMQSQNTMFMQQQGNAMLMQQQGNNTLMMQKNNAGNVMMMQQGQQSQPDMMRMMQQASNSDDFGFPQAPMGSGPPIAQNGNQFYNAYTQQQQGASPQQQVSQPQQQNTSPNDPFAQFGQNVFR